MLNCDHPVLGNPGSCMLGGFRVLCYRVCVHAGGVLQLLLLGTCDRHEALNLPLGNF